MEKPLNIAELARMAGVTVRTVRYYVQMGLLPPGRKDGAARLYDRTHLQCLRAIAEMKKQFLPLKEIRRRLSAMSHRDIAGGQSDSGMDDVARVETTQVQELHSIYGGGIHGEKEFRQEFQPQEWQRVELAPGVELHYVRPDDMDTDELIRDLIREVRRHKARYRNMVKQGSMLV